MARKSKRSPESTSSRTRRLAAQAPAAAQSTSFDRVAATLLLLAWNFAFCGLLLVAIGYAYSPVVVGHDINFIHFDDDRYVFGNAEVVHGLTPQTIWWAFTSLSYDNWHPLTWMSHMLDCQIYGVQGGAWGHHLTSVVLHGLTSIGLFVALSRLTRASWPSALATLLFAVHPLRAESVAWISERKDLLSGLFFVLTLWMYGEYARSKSLLAIGSFYALTLLFYALGLMSKPMLVSVPILLLLLDFWPLRRVEGGGWWVAGYAKHDRETLPSPSTLHPSPYTLLLEKLPFFVMAAVSCYVTVKAQQGAMLVIDRISFGLRLENAIVSYAAYIVELFAPINLAPLYPFPEHGLPIWKVVLAGVFMLAISAFVVAARKRRYLAVGWLWYLVALLPVIGLVQVGVQGMADRYTYLPHIGLAIAIAWLLYDATSAWPLRDLIWAVLVLALAGVLAIATRQQVATWKNDGEFFTHALKVNPRISTAHNNFGFLIEHQNQPDATERAKQRDLAEWHYRQAVEIRPRYVEAHINLAEVLLTKSQSNQDKVAAKKQIHEAIDHLKQATEIRPDYGPGFVNLGVGFLNDGRQTEAEAAFRKAIELDADDLDAHTRLASALIGANKIDDGARELNEVLRINSNNVSVLETLGKVYLLKQKPDLAIEYFKKCIAAGGQQPPAGALSSLAYLQYKAGRPAEAIAAWRKQLQIKPESLTALVMMSWILATSDDNAVRDGAEAKRLAQQAIELAGERNPQPLMALAAALAERGQFDEAVKTAQRAAVTAQLTGAAEFARFAGVQEISYKAHLPYRDHAAADFFSLSDILIAK